MKVRLVISASGEIGLFSVSGTFAEGQTKLPLLATAIGAANGISNLPIDDVEQHRHDQPHLHEHVEDHAHGR
jgi:hypothetical protein